MPGPTLVYKMWEGADKAYDALQALKGADLSKTDEIALAKGVVTGYCECLALFMHPHFKTPLEVANEIIRRAEARKSGDTSYETPGLGTRRFDSPPGVERERPRKAVPPQKPPAAAYSASTIEAIKLANRQNYPLEKIAEIFGGTVEQVKAVLT